MRVIGLDIGGANIKASDGEQRSTSRSFPVWQRPDRLAEELQSLLCEFDAPQHLAVTMTAELADCFASKAEGVKRILTAVDAAANVPIHVWQHSGEFVTPTEAMEFPLLTAAANWHALATWAGRMAPAGRALLIDHGSTTTDIIPIVDGLPQTVGMTDCERLAAGELVYTGCRRTPLCAVARSVRVKGHAIPLAAEFFATMHDVHLILGTAQEDPGNHETADGRPATIDCSRSRLARMLCCDRTELTVDELAQFARQLRDSQLQQLKSAMSQVLAHLASSPTSLLISGEGEVTCRRLIDAFPALTDCERISLRDCLGSHHSTNACAFALARLGSERIR